jgi:hypothetical protein
MSFLTNVEVFHKPEVGYFVLKTSRFNIFKKITGSHVTVHFTPAFSGAKMYEIEDAALATKILESENAFQAMAHLRATTS